MKYAPLILCLVWLHPHLYAQKPTNDECHSPISLKINEWLYDQLNENATTRLNELPPAVPLSCINTFENDLWYKIPTHNLKNPLKILIIPTSCNTPAGLQAILYHHYDCSQLSQNFLACANKDISDTITFIVEKPYQYPELMLYVDGFDGTVCHFHIAVLELPHFNPFDFCKSLRFDYAERTPNSQIPLTLSTQNNQIKIQWQHESPNILGYAIQIKMIKGYKTLSCFSPSLYVAENQNLIEYLYNPDQLSKEKLCFRVLTFYADSIAVSEDHCIEPKVITHFWVSPPKPTQPNEFEYIYKINKALKAQIQLKNSKGQVLKSKTLSLKKGNFVGTISTQGLPKDRYFFEFCAENDCFQYPLLEP